MTALPAAELVDHPTPLIGPDDPPPFRLHNRQGRARALLLADHAGVAMPAAYDHLGLGQVPLGRHIAYDIGTGWLTERLAVLLDAPALLHNYSRLMIDPNRPLDDPTSICAISDGVVIPGNRHVDTAEAAARAESFHRPYHRAIDAGIDRSTDRGIVPAIIAMHSFTPVLRGFERPWHLGVLWADDARFPVALMTMLGRDPELCIGDNEPYSGRNMHGYTIECHALPRGLPNVLIEVRQDLIDTPEAAAGWAERLAQPLLEILADETLYRIAGG